MTRVKIEIMLLFLILLLNSAGWCIGDTVQANGIPSDSQSDSNGTISDAESSIVTANNQFAFDMFSNLTNDPAYHSKNIFFSPFSISSVMAVAYDGARSKSADEIASVFHYPRDNTTLRMGYSALSDGLDNRDPQFRLDIANAVWAEKTYPFLDAYLKDSKTYYRANVSNLDFKNAPDISRKVINSWVLNATNGKITDLIEDGGITPDVKLVITNAVYFNGSWANPFDISKTKETGFKITEDQSVSVPMMQGVNDDAMFFYNVTDDLQILEMPYKHTGTRSLGMIVLLPKDGNLTALEERLNYESLSEIRRSLYPVHVNVFFPKLKLNTKYELSDTLQKMGVRTGFSKNADFSGMDGSQNLYIGGVIHQGSVDINEQGTEASAATGMVLETMSIPMNNITFKADHPFIFIIEDQENGNILFIGRILNPNE